MLLTARCSALADPPRCVGGESKSALPVELVDRTHQPKVPSWTRSAMSTPRSWYRRPSAPQPEVGGHHLLPCSIISGHDPLGQLDLLLVIGHRELVEISQHQSQCVRRAHRALHHRSRRSFSHSQSYVPGPIQDQSTCITRPASGSFHRVFAPNCVDFRPVLSTPHAGRIVLLRHGATEWSENGNTRVARYSPAPRGLRPGHGCRAAGPPDRSRHVRQVLTSPLVRAAEPAGLAGFVGQPDPDLEGMGLRRLRGAHHAEIRQLRPGWTLWDDGVPEGERAADVGRRVDAFIQRALQSRRTPSAWPMDTSFVS